MNILTNRVPRPNKKVSRLIKGIQEEDWIEFNKLKAWHNENFPDRKVSWGVIFKLFNTYRPIIQSLFQLNPDDSPIQRLGVNTALIHAKMWTSNIGNNVARIKLEHDIKEFKGKFKDKSAIIIGAGESLKNNASGTDHLKVIREYVEKGYDGIIIVAGHILEDCLKIGIGDYFTVVDGSDLIYSKYFDNTTIKKFNKYLKSPSLELHVPDEALKMKAIMATCTHPKVVNAWNGDIFFFVASIPAEILPNATPLMCDFTGTSDINAGGNCGMLAWNIAMWMGIREVALVGMDYSYKITTPHEQTSNWEQYETQLGAEQAKIQAFQDGYNKFFETPYRIDDIYQAFKSVAHVWFKGYKEHGYNTYNCTEGGALEGEGIEQMYLKDFLESHMIKAKEEVIA